MRTLTTDNAHRGPSFRSTALALMMLSAILGAPLACGSAKPRPVVAEVSLDASTPEAPPEPPPPPPLYTRLGGKPGVAAIVDSFIDDLLADKRLKKPFAATKGPKLEHFKQMLNDQLCEISGGGCHYTGKTMPDAHAGMKITSAQFDAFVSDLQLALEEKQVSKDDGQALLEQLNLLKDQIVTGK